MRKHLLLFLLLGTLSAVAQSPYEIYRCDPSVRYKVLRGTAWTPAQAHQSVAAVDSLRIPAGEHASVLHRPSGQLYHSLETGSMSVYDLIHLARRQSGNALGLITQQMHSQLAASGSQTTYAVVGVTTRGDESPVEDSLAVVLRHRAAEAAPRSPSQPEDSLRVVPVVEDGETWFFFHNTASTVRYVNLMRVDPDTRQMALLYHHLPLEMPCIELRAGQKLELPMVRFVLDTKAVLVSVVSPCSFDSDRLSDILQRQ